MTNNYNYEKDIEDITLDKQKDYYERNKKRSKKKRKYYYGDYAKALKSNKQKTD